MTVKLPRSPEQELQAINARLDNLSHEFNLAREHAVFLHGVCTVELPALRRTVLELAERVATYRHVLRDLAICVDAVVRGELEPPAELSRVLETMGKIGTFPQPPVQ